MAFRACSVHDARTSPALKKNLSFLLCLFLALLLPLSGHAADNDADAVLTSAEDLFTSMRQGDYPRIWACLSLKSQDTIVHDICKAMSSGSCSEKAIADDFAKGEALSRAYWDAYLKNFDPAMVLEESRWEMGSLTGDRASITLTFKKAQKPATLRLFREGGLWKVGLTESFWSRK